MQPVRSDQGLAAPGDYPLIEVGWLTLNRSAASDFADLEQVAFSPSDMALGIA